MSSEPKIIPVDTADTSKPASFPGYKEAVEAFDRTQTYLKKQADLWNGAWSEIVQGKFSFNRWIALTASSVDEHYRFLRSFASAPSILSQSPPWLAITLEPEDRKVSAAAFLPRPLLASVAVPHPFTPLDRAGAATQLIPTAEETGDGRLLVTVDLDAEGPDKGRRPPAGRYVTFLFANGKPQAPVLVVMLDVLAPRPDAASAPRTQR